MAQAVPEACPREERAHAFGGAIEAIGQDASDAIGRLLDERRTLEHLLGLGTGRGTGFRGITQVPEHPPLDNRGHIDLGRQTVTGLFVRQEIRGQGQPTPRQHRHQPLVAERPDGAVERHGRAMMAHRAQRHTEAAMRRSEGVARHRRAHRARAQDEMRQHGEPRFAHRTLEPPDGDATEPDPGIMGGAGATPTAVTRGLVGELKAQGHHEGDDQFHKGLAIAQEWKVGRFVLKSDRDGAVFSWSSGCACAPPRASRLCRIGTTWGSPLVIARAL